MQDVLIGICLEIQPCFLWKVNRQNVQEKIVQWLHIFHSGHEEKGQQVIGKMVMVQNALLEKMNKEIRQIRCSSPLGQDILDQCAMKSCRVIPDHEMFIVDIPNIGRVLGMMAISVIFLAQETRIVGQNLLDLLDLIFLQQANQTNWRHWWFDLGSELNSLPDIKKFNFFSEKN